MSLTDVRDWMNEFSDRDFIWYLKRLAGNDTLANQTHQAGPYIPKQVLFHIFPQLNNPQIKNPEIRFDCYIDSHSDCRRVRAIWYNNKYHGGTRNETRVTRFGGASSALLDPESTGALAVFAFGSNDNQETKCHVWVSRHGTEEDIIEERVGPVEPGRSGWRVWPTDQFARSNLFESTIRARSSCHLSFSELPDEWLTVFPAPIELIQKSLELRPARSLCPDDRLVKRRQCEAEIFYSIEKATAMPLIKRGFESLEDFVSLAQTILQRRKARAGRSLELHTKEILLEENIQEGTQFSFQPESDPGKRPDFLFPSEVAYKDRSFPDRKLRMLAVKTTCRDRWRQILNEADRISEKHLLTLQHGVSEKQFREMREANVKLVVPEPLKKHFPSSVQPHLQSLESFITDVRLLSV